MRARIGRRWGAAERLRLHRHEEQARGSSHCSGVRDRILGMPHSGFFRMDTVIETSTREMKVNAWDEP